MYPLAQLYDSGNREVSAVTYGTDGRVPNVDSRNIRERILHRPHNLPYHLFSLILWSLRQFQNIVERVNITLGKRSGSRSSKLPHVRPNLKDFSNIVD